MAHSPVKGAALELDGLHKRFGEHAAVDGVSLQAAAGEFLTLLGPSGSGKTTTLNMVAGFLAPTAGRIFLDGREIDHLPTHRRNIGVVFQHYALFPHMTASQNVAFPLKQRKQRGAEMRRRVGEALELVGLGGYAGHYPRQLSGGQQQRVALARAIVFEPSLLLMDEPLGALDRKLREHLQLEIKRIHRELGITFVYVTHDQEEALVLSDRIAIFNDGRIEQLGSAEEVYDRPATLFAAEFLGESNRLPVVAGDEAGTARVTGLGTTVRCAAPLSHGGDAYLVVRPERLRAAGPGGDAAAGCNRISGVVTQVVYLGSARRMEVELAPGMRMAVREQAGGWSSAAEGDAVELTWEPADGVVLPGEPSRARPSPEPVAA